MMRCVLCHCAECFVYTARDAAAWWFPSVESQTERCTFEVEVTCPAEFWPVASGRLTRHITADELDAAAHTPKTPAAPAASAAASSVGAAAAAQKHTLTYTCDVPVVARSIGLAVAPFRVPRRT